MSFVSERVDCAVCKERVFPLEAVKYDGLTYHKGCMRCTHCNKTVSVKGLAMIDSKIYCKPHFKELFKQTGGSYDAFSSSTTTANKSSSSAQQQQQQQQQQENEESTNTAQEETAAEDDNENRIDDGSDQYNTDRFAKSATSGKVQWGKPANKSKPRLSDTYGAASSSWTKKNDGENDDGEDELKEKENISSSARKWGNKNSNYTTSSSGTGSSNSSNMPAWKQKALAAKAAQQQQQQQQQQPARSSSIASASTTNSSSLVGGSGHGDDDVEEGNPPEAASSSSLKRGNSKVQIPSYLQSDNNDKSKPSTPPWVKKNRMKMKKKKEEKDSAARKDVDVDESEEPESLMSPYSMARTATLAAAANTEEDPSSPPVVVSSKRRPSSSSSDDAPEPPPPPSSARQSSSGLNKLPPKPSSATAATTKNDADDKKNVSRLTTSSGSLRETMNLYRSKKEETASATAAAAAAAAATAAIAAEDDEDEIIEESYSVEEEEEEIVDYVEEEVVVDDDDDDDHEEMEKREEIVLDEHDDDDDAGYDDVEKEVDDVRVPPTRRLSRRALRQQRDQQKQANAEPTTETNNVAKHVAEDHSQPTPVHAGSVPITENPSGGPIPDSSSKPEENVTFRSGSKQKKQGQEQAKTEKNVLSPPADSPTPAEATSATISTTASDSFVPISTDNLPLRHSAARKAATNPEEYYITTSGGDAEADSDSGDNGPRPPEKDMNEDDPLFSKPVLVPQHDNNIAARRSDSYDNLESWMVPHRHDDDSSWVNPIREVDVNRKRELTDGIEATSRSKALTLYFPGKSIGGSRERTDDATVSTIGQFSVTQGQYEERNIGSDVKSHTKITDHTWALPSTATREQRILNTEEAQRANGKDYRFSYIAAPHTHSTASYSDSVREKFFPKQDNPIWEPKSQPTTRLDNNTKSVGGGGLLATAIGEDDSWMPPDEATVLMSVADDEEKKKMNAAEEENYPKSVVSVETAEFDWTPEAISVTRTRRIDFTGRITDDSENPASDEEDPEKKSIDSSSDDSEEEAVTTWNPVAVSKLPRSVRNEQTTVWAKDDNDNGPQDMSTSRGTGRNQVTPRPESKPEETRDTQKVQSIPESRPQEATRGINVQPAIETENADDDNDEDEDEDEDEEDEEESEDSDEVSEEESIDAFPAPKDSSAESRRYRESKHGAQDGMHGGAYDEEAPRHSRNRSTSSQYATTASGRVSFVLKPETILIDSDVEAEHGRRRRKKSEGPFSDDRMAKMLCFTICLLFLGGLATALYFLVFRDDPTNPPPVSNVGPGNGNSTLGPTPVPNSNPIPPSSSPVDKPTDGQSKPPTPAPIPPTRAPIVLEPTDDALLSFLAQVSSDGGAALLDPTSPQFEAMQWIRTPANQGIFDDRLFLQRYALATIYFSTNGDGWFSSDGWLTDAAVCEWYSASQEPATSRCDSEGNLVELDLTFNNLVGGIPPEISLLSDSLEVLHLSRNNLNGVIPRALTLLTKLSSLQLAGNDFIAGLLDGLESLTDLRHLIVGGNRLSTEIPSSIGSLRDLKQLDLSNNQFHGNLPLQLALLTDLEFLSLRQNDLEGMIPQQFQSLRGLKFLYLDGNSFHGPAPNNAFCNILDLTEFWADCNEIDCECCTQCCVDGTDCRRTLQSFG